MKMRLHTISNGRLHLELECESELERDILKFVVEDARDVKGFLSGSDRLYIESKKKIKEC